MPEDLRLPVIKNKLMSYVYLALVISVVLPFNLRYDIAVFVFYLTFVYFVNWFSFFMVPQVYFHSRMACKLNSNFVQILDYFLINNDRIIQILNVMLFRSLTCRALAYWRFAINCDCHQETYCFSPEMG